jgi:hypothetical protein
MITNLSLLRLTVIPLSTAAFYSSPFFSSPRSLFFSRIRSIRSFSPFLNACGFRFSAVVSASAFSHFLSTPLLFESSIGDFITAIKTQVYDSETSIVIEHTFFKRCVGTHAPGGAVSVVAQGASLEISLCDFFSCVHQVDRGGAVAIKKAESVRLRQCCFVKCSAAGGSHVCTIEMIKSEAEVHIDQNFVGENGNLRSPVMFSMTSGRQQFELSNCSFNVAPQVVGIAITAPEKVNMMYVLFVGNANGELIGRKTWAEKSELLSFVNIIQNNLTAVFTGQMFANARSMLVFRNRIKAFVDLTDQCIFAISDSAFDFDEGSPVLRNRNSHFSVRFDQCQFGIRATPTNANLFSWKSVCFVITNVKFPLTPQAAFRTFFDVVAMMIASPHGFGAAVLVVTLIFVTAIALYRRDVARRYGFGLPAGFTKPRGNDLVPSGDYAGVGA